VESPVLVLLGYPLGKRYISCIVSLVVVLIYLGYPLDCVNTSKSTQVLLLTSAIRLKFCCCGFASSVGLTIELELLSRPHNTLGPWTSSAAPTSFLFAQESVLFVFTLPHPRSILQRRALRLSGLDCGSGL